MKTIYHPKYIELIQYLIASRKSIPLTQSQLAQALNKPQSYVAKVEGCERKLDVFEFIMWCQTIGIVPSDCIRMIEGHK